MNILNTITLQHPSLLPIIFKHSFPSLNTLSTIFSTCKTWANQKEITWKAILQDSSCPQFRRYEILAHLSFFGNRAKHYLLVEKPTHATNVLFLQNYCPSLVDESDIENLIEQEEFEKAFAWSSNNLELQSKLINYLIHRLDHRRTLELILLFTTESTLTNFCITYLTKCAEKSDLLIQLKREELPLEEEIESFLQTPFINSLILLKEHTLENIVFNTFIKLCIIPTLNYLPCQSKLFKMLPDNFWFYEEVEEIYHFFDEILEPVTINHPKDLLNKTSKFIEALKKIPHPNLRYIMAQNILDTLYTDYGNKKWDAACWPHLYTIEREFGCENNSTQKIRNLLTMQESFSRAFNDTHFTKTLIALIEHEPKILAIIMAEDLEIELNKVYVQNVFFDIVLMLNKHCKHLCLRNLFIQSAPDYLKPHLQQVNSKKG